MKTKHTLFIVMIFVLAFTAACGGTATPAPSADAPPAEAPAVVEEQPAEVAVEEPAEIAVEEPAEASAEEPAAPLGVGMDFVMPEDASNVMEIGNGTINFQTALSIPDVVTFYRFAFPDYVEREVVTVVEDGTFNLVFDGHESGQAVVIQGFPMSEGIVNVSIRLEAQ